MIVINTRSPYFITINETGQKGSRIELFIWNAPGTIPANPNYTFSKPIASDTQTETNYNISSFVKEYIDNVSTADNTNLMFANVSVKKYKLNSDNTYTLLGTDTFIGVNGYTKFLDGHNKTNTNTNIVLFTNNNKPIYYDRSKSDLPYVNLFIDSATGDKFELNYSDLRGRNVVNDIIVETTDSATKTMLKIPFTTTLNKYDKGNNIELKFTKADETVYSYSFKVLPVCEPKYTPIVCTFINRFGGWEFLTFFKAQMSNYNVKGTSYNLLPSGIDYNPTKGQSKSFNINGMQTIKLNSGWLPEEYNDTIQDLLLSEVVLLDNVPVEVKTQTQAIKTSLQDRNINFEIEFGYSFNLINNVI
jgi:hypothetical protein